MSQEAWPTPHESSREPLPRVEDLPIAEQGYEPESVRAAFDSFYRHAAQLDAALRTLETVDSFQRQASALRADIRTLRTAGWTQQPWSPGPTYGYVGRGPREGVSPAVWRIAGEAAFLIAVAVVLGIAKVTWWVIVLVMACAWLLVGLLEWAAARDRFAAPRPIAEPVEPPHPVVEATPSADRIEEEPLGWTAFEEAQEPSDAMTMIGAPALPEEAVAEEQPVDEPVDAGPPPAAEAAAEEPPEAAEEPEPVVEAAVAEEAPVVEAASEPEPEHEPEPEAAEPEPETAPPEPVSVAEPEQEPLGAPEPEQPRRRWWRRRQDEVEPPSDAAAPLAATPRHVRILGDEERQRNDVDPWEAGFDDDFPGEPEPEATGEPPTAEPDEDTGEDAAAVAAEHDDTGRRRFRRR